MWSMLCPFLLVKLTSMKLTRFTAFHRLIIDCSSQSLCSRARIRTLSPLSVLMVGSAPLLRTYSTMSRYLYLTAHISAVMLFWKRGVRLEFGGGGSYLSGLVDVVALLQELLQQVKLVEERGGDYERDAGLGGTRVSPRGGQNF
jgi:hypothetical protein